ncbi:MAG: anti-sigma factor family protein [Chloroflexota bacterium]
MEHLSELLSAYVDGELGHADRAQVDQHLAECGACSRELDSLRSLVGLLRKLPERPLPRSFLLGPRPLRRPAALRGDLAGFVRAFSSIAAVLLFVATGLSLGRSGMTVVGPNATRSQTATSTAARPQVAAAPRAAAPAFRPAGGAGHSAAGAQAAPARAAQPLGPQPPAARPAAPSPPGLNIPFMAAELSLLALSAGFAVYSVRWWRR